jgi:ABC-2 type transport system ATP-binding protein
MQFAIEARQLTRAFGNLVAVDHIDFQVKPGEVFGALGPNGAGKTTMVRLLNGVLAATEGQPIVMGKDAGKEGAAVRAQTGVLTETPSLYERLTARENLLLFGTLYGMSGPKLSERVDQLLELFGLSKRGQDKAGGYSKGMKQRLAIARSLVHNPPILFLDEPTSGLDPEAAHQVIELVAELSHEEGRTVFFATHHLTDAERLCDRVALFNHGKILAQGSIPELAKRLWGGEWVEIELMEPASEINERLGWQNTQCLERTLRIQADQPDAIAKSVASVIDAGGRIIRVQPHAYTLEEIYFAYQRGEAK